MEITEEDMGTKNDEKEKEKEKEIEFGKKYSRQSDGVSFPNVSTDKVNDLFDNLVQKIIKKLKINI